MYGSVSEAGSVWPLRYTLDSGRLSAGQRRAYERDGFLLVRRLVPHALLERCRHRFLELIAEDADRGFIQVTRDISLKNRTDISAERIVNKIQDFSHDDILSQYVKLPELLDYVEGFSGRNIQAIHSMLINKPPDAGTNTSRHPMHQDLHYFPLRPADSIVCAWTAMEPVHEDNGCLFVLPGTHTTSLQRHEYPQWQNGVNKLYHGVRGFDGVKKLLLPMETGDTVFFHPLLIHGSGPNVTKGFRKAISCHYAAVECHYIDVTGTSQEGIAAEVVQIAKRRLNSLEDISYEDIWRLRSRLVRGEVGDDL